MPTESAKSKPKSRQRLSAIEANRRQKVIKQLRYVQCLSNPEICEKLNISKSTLKRSLVAIRKSFKKESEDDDVLTNILNEIKSRKDERIRILFNELDKNEQDELAAVNATSGKFQKNGLPVKVPVQAIRHNQKMRILSEIRKCDDSYTESIRKLGIGVGDDKDKIPSVNIWNNIPGGNNGNKSDVKLGDLETEFEKVTAFIRFGNSGSPDRF